MKWPWRRQRAIARPTEEAEHAAAQAARGLQDAHAMRAQATDLNRKAEEVAAKLEQTRQRNHFREAVERSMQRKRA